MNTQLKSHDHFHHNKQIIVKTNPKELHVQKRKTSITQMEKKKNKEIKPEFQVFQHLEQGTKSYD